MFATSVFLLTLAQAAPAQATTPQAAASQTAAPAAAAAAAPQRRRPRAKVPTKSEVEAQARTTFREMDGNHDGKVSRDEAAKLHAANVAAQAERERQAREAVFARLDQNKDGSISRQEFEVTTANRPQPQEAWFDANDIDRNGIVVLNEAVAKSLRNFEAIDTNNNGVLSADELRSARARRPRAN
jgi:Ca2+-binding EF-hand superfamily protein